MDAGYGPSVLLEKGGKAKKQSLNYNREARNILERLAESGDRETPYWNLANIIVKIATSTG